MWAMNSETFWMQVTWLSTRYPNFWRDLRAPRRSCTSANFLFAYYPVKVQGALNKLKDQNMKSFALWAGQWSDWVGFNWSPQASLSPSGIGWFVGLITRPTIPGILSYDNKCDLRVMRHMILRADNKYILKLFTKLNDILLYRLLFEFINQFCKCIIFPHSSSLFIGLYLSSPRRDRKPNFAQEANAPQLLRTSTSREPYGNRSLEVTNKFSIYATCLPPQTQTSRRQLPLQRSSKILHLNRGTSR